MHLDSENKIRSLHHIDMKWFECFDKTHKQVNILINPLITSLT